MSNADIIKDFIERWSGLDAAELANFFTDDGCYHNMPAQPVRGKAAIEDFIRGFLATWTETQWDIRHIVESGDIVFCERLDRTRTTNGDVDLPCVGVFEMQDGKIREWRDYFDMDTYMRAMKA